MKSFTDADLSALSRYARRATKKFAAKGLEVAAPDGHIVMLAEQIDGYEVRFVKRIYMAVQIPCVIRNRRKALKAARAALMTGLRRLERAR